MNSGKRIPKSGISACFFPEEKYGVYLQARALPVASLDPPERVPHTIEGFCNKGRSRNMVGNRRVRDRKGTVRLPERNRKHGAPGSPGPVYRGAFSSPEIRPEGRMPRKILPILWRKGPLQRFAERISDYIRRRTESGVGPKTIGNDLALLSKLFNGTNADRQTPGMDLQGLCLLKYRS